jgi:hypothetical protein
MALLTTEQRVLAKATNGSQTIWTGRPLAGFRLRKGDFGRLAPLIIVIPFFAFWEYFAVSLPKADFMGIAFPLFGFLVFCLVIAQTAGEVLWNFYARSRTYYALTADGYAIVFTNLFGGMTKRVYLPLQSEINLDVKLDRSGSISFGQAYPAPWWMRQSVPVIRPPSFDFIANASAVYDLCTKLQQGKTA